jgi:hypothetical protein
MSDAPATPPAAPPSDPPDDDARFRPPAPADVELEVEAAPRVPGLGVAPLDRVPPPSPRAVEAPAPYVGALGRHHAAERDRVHAAALARRRSRGLRLCALALFAGSLALALVNQRQVGIARDEVVYVGAGKAYARWWLDVATFAGGRTDEAGITRTWGGKGATDNNREHPPLMKTLFGLSQVVLHDKLDVASEITASRAATAAVHALAIAVLFLWVAAGWGVAEGVIAALCALLVPRALFHAGVACFDAPIAAWWLLTLYAYWRGLGHRGWAVAAGVLWGCALATKHNALLVPLAIAPHFVWVSIREYRGPGRLGPLAALVAVGRGLRARWLSAASLVVLGPLTLVALWPWLWFDTVDHVEAWIRFHTQHVHYNFEYLGDNWNHPPFPWHVAIVTTLLTVPVATLAAALLGAVRGVVDARAGGGRERTTAPGALLVLSLLVAMGPFVLGSTPIFGAEKHWMAAGYTIAAAAGLGAVWAARAAARALAARWPRLSGARVELAAVIAVGAIVAGAAAAETLHAQPYALSSYNALAGGAPGGAELGMNRQFWGYAARGVAPYLRTQAPPAGGPARPVYSHDASPAWGWYRRAGLLPGTLPDSGSEYAGGVERSQLAIVIHERHFNRHDYLIWSAYRTVQPVYVLRFDGVPLVSVYRRPAPPGPGR